MREDGGDSAVHEPAIRIAADAEALADTAAALVAERAGTAIAARGRFLMALSGGSTPLALYTRLGGPWRDRIDWTHLHLFWGDERTVPPAHHDSNYRMAHEALITRVPVPPHQVHRIRGELAPVVAAIEYERTLRTALGTAGREATSPAGLDLVLLGLGIDGHTASLFPGRPPAHETERWVVADEIDGRGTWRVTLTPPVLNAARCVAFLVAGAGKAAILRDVLEGARVPDALPAQAIRPRPGALVWLVDRAAASALSRPSGGTMS